MRLILASASPRRAELLQAAGFDLEVAPVPIDERVKPGETPEAYVVRLASEKSARAQQLAHTTSDGSRPSAPGIELPVVLGADTAVVAAGHILGKPRNREDAAEMMVRLSGRWHDVLTGVSVRRGDRELTAVETTRVLFATLTPDEVSWYVASGEGADKAGGYAIQGLGSRFVARVEGSYSNVVGLPVATVYALLGQLNGTR